MIDAIGALYPYALAEGEGVGTAYEYVAKARVVRRLIAGLRRGGRVLVAGLPEKYGTSLDFAILAHKIAAELHVADDRAAAIDRARCAIESMQAAGRLTGLQVSYRRVDALAAVSSGGPHDLVLSCEVLQRVAPAARIGFARALRAAAPRGAVFVPNAENGSHLEISGLAGLSLRGARALFEGARSGYVDMPPFPPGIARSPEQRARASTGWAEAAAMRMLDVYCATERAVPGAVKRHFAHIVWVTWGGV
jgi:hypothetical protein